jgi:ammonia channel protein AmtB
VDKLVGLRVLPEVEIQGLDVSETGVLGYPDGQMGGKE